MFLLNEYRNQTIFVVHVNYHLRKDSDIDQKIVEDFCKHYGIQYKVLDVKTKAKGNVENWAREIRYKFFKEQYDLVGANQLLTGHHKDDFLETATMQQESGRLPSYFGIRKKINNFGMVIIRPFINLYWKEQILYELDEDNIKYAIDSTNDEPIYTRNKVRIELAKLTKKEKQSRYSWFKMSNKILVKKWKRIDKKYNKWEQKEFSTIMFESFGTDKQEIVFKYIHSNYESIKLSSSKIKSIIQFIESKEGGKIFKLNSKTCLTKKQSKLKETTCH